ncbi:alpha/beta hydrolase fold domain-containing protein [Plantactinospora sp. S1510]|uniref:Alpha/beta hydrolase fold domain-containing protein n=1 Tax=Plantactinospora alkalitolerans TaxID=2789879 RepID=A0ABS0GPQ5_9ACTN|nr:alpha/beta hydrolase fold domain-containing protein [Plantactinospora alkalitolerans]MBF9128071.1 alpha/beta hydrolase fold domain-containing protein [Plantactinospora alkalitolerans]
MDEEGPSGAGRVIALPAAPDAIELRHLRAFVAVAEELNFGRAATRLYLSQPALSRQIRALERLLGCDLLRRSTHRVELTLAGDALLERTRRILGDVDDAVTVTRSVGGELATRIRRVWEDAVGDTNAGSDVAALREVTEALHGRFVPPAEVAIRPVNSGGVSSLLLCPEPQAPTSLLYLHGGGNVSGSAFGYRHLAGALAVAAGVGTLLPDYRLAPEHPFPAQLEDAMRAYLWLVDRETHPRSVIVVGDSSGAGLVMALLLSLRQQQGPLPGGAILLCPGVDLSGALIRRSTDDGPQLAVTPEQVRSLAALYLGGHPVDDPVIDPLNADLTGLPPLLIQAGTGDFVVDEAKQLAARARAHGVDVQLELYPAATHGFHTFWSFLPEAADALQQAGSFAQRVRTRRPAANTSW